MSTLIIVESCFGNTESVAQKISDALPDSRIVAADTAPTDLAGVTLLLVGAPTHNLNLPTPASRAQAQGSGGRNAPGVREWIAAVTPRADLKVVTFDTVVKSAFSGSAAKDAAKRLKRRGFKRAERGESFIVAGTPPRLLEGEVDRARGWGAGLI